MRTKATQEHNDTIRKELVEHIYTYGSTRVHIAKQTGLSNNTIGKFAANELNLSVESLGKINAFLMKFRKAQGV